MILNSPYISGSLTVTGNATIQGSISGTITGSDQYIGKYKNV